MYRKPSWVREGIDWPHHETSQFIQAGGLSWHVQIAGQGPALLLLHGTGASSHSWAGLLSGLRSNFTVIAPDLPGHGFTATPPGAGLSIPGMAQLICALMNSLGHIPSAIVGHSAGAALGADLILGQKLGSPDFVALNGAFKPFDGLAAHIFPVAAKLLVLNPVTIFALASSGGDMAKVRRLMEGTGSHLDDKSLELYARLFSCPGHVAAVMGMMARWELHKLVPRLSLLRARTTLIVGSNDQTISPTVSRDVAQIIPDARFVSLAGLGHLAHEENPAMIIRELLEAIRR
jgi:magnesium chelatase accessory protein